MIRKLSNDETIAVCKFDKGNGVVVLYKEEYNKKCITRRSEILSDTSKFKKLNSNDITDTIMRKRKSLQSYIYRYFYKHDKVDELTYNELYDVGGNPGKFYGLIKVHKMDIELDQWCL